MKTETLLNTLILSLSVSTVLITLISYLIYKMKQFPKTGKEVKEATKKEGTYFRRHVPGQAEEEVKPEEAAKANRFKRFNTLPFYFGLLGLVIFTSLIFKDVFNNFYSKWEHKRHISKVQELRSRGLLALRDFNVEKKSEPLQEFVPELSRKFMAQKVEKLKNKKIVVLAWPNNLKHNREHFLKSLQGWKMFFDRNKIPFKVEEGLSNHDGDVFLLPQPKSLSLAQSAYLDTLMKEKKSLFVTGTCGVLDGTGEPSKSNWCESTLGLKIQTRAKKSPSLPTLFASRRTPGWIIPPGLLLNWFPEDDDYQSLNSSLLEISSFEARFNGKANLVDKKYSVRSQYKTVGGSKLGWIALEPHGIAGKAEVDVFYAEAALIESLSWMTDPSHVELGFWKKGKSQVFTLSVDSEELIEGAYDLWKFAEKSQTPTTFFIVSEQLARDTRLIKLESPLAEIANHSLDHSIMTEKSLDFQFNNIQDSRMALEEKSAQPILGFHPPEEKFNEDTVNAVLQNEFQYLVGDQRFYRLAPLFIHPELVYFPRVMKDDVLIKKNRGLVSPEEILAVLNRDQEEARILGGIHYLNTHSQIMGQGYLKEIMEDFLDQDFPKSTWKANFSMLNSWWRQRSQIEITLQDDLVVVTNRGKETIEELELFIGGTPIEISRLKSGEEKSIPTK